MQRHPVDQVRQLAQASPDSWDDVTILEDHALDVAPSASGSSDPSPEGERLSWAEDHSVQRSRGNLEVFYLVPLHPHRVTGERADQGCSVFKHRVPQQIPRISAQSLRPGASGDIFEWCSRIFRRGIGISIIWWANKNPQAICPAFSSPFWQLVSRPGFTVGKGHRLDLEQYPVAPGASLSTYQGRKGLHCRHWLPRLPQRRRRKSRSAP